MNKIAIIAGAAVALVLCVFGFAYAALGVIMHDDDPFDGFVE